MNFFRKHPFWTQIFLMIGLSILIIVGLFFYLNIYTRHNQSVYIPDVRGMKLEEAVAKLNLADLEYEVVDSNYFEQLAPGAVYETIPEVGAKVKPGRIVFLTINALSPRLVQLPSNLEGMSMRQAKATLEGLGFKVKSVRQVEGEFEGLTVGVEDTFNKRLSAGSKVPAGAALVLLVTASKAFSVDSLDLNFSEDPVGVTIHDDISSTPIDEDEEWW